jgi:hypothetical protein
VRGLLGNDEHSCLARDLAVVVLGDDSVQAAVFHHAFFNSQRIVISLFIKFTILNAFSLTVFVEKNAGFWISVDVVVSKQPSHLVGSRNLETFSTMILGE